MKSPGPRWLKPSSADGWVGGQCFTLMGGGWRTHPCAVGGDYTREKGLGRWKVSTPNKASLPFRPSEAPQGTATNKERVEVWGNPVRRTGTIQKGGDPYTTGLTPESSGPSEGDGWCEPEGNGEGAGRGGWDGAGWPGGDIRVERKMRQHVDRVPQCHVAKFSPCPPSPIGREVAATKRLG